MTRLKAIEQPSRTFAEPRRHRPKYHYRGMASRGRMWLLAIFCALRGIEVLIYLGTTASDKSRLIGTILVNVVWTTALLTGIWLRQNWARYVLILLMFIDVVSSMIFVPELVSRTTTTATIPHIVPILVGACLV